MAKKKFLPKDDINQYKKELNAVHEANLKLIEEEQNSLNKSLNMREKMMFTSSKLSEQQKILNNLYTMEGDIAEAGYHIRKNNLKELEKQRSEQRKIVDGLKREQAALEKKIKTQQTFNEALKKTGNLLNTTAKSMYDFLMKSDKAIKEVNLSLGLSSERAELMRESFEESARFSAHLGMDMEGLAKMATVYAEETGRARMHSAENLKSMTAIAKGTNLGAEGAAQMAAQYEMMGYNATDTSTEVQRIVDTTERMGVNTGKVLKAVNKNFKTLQKYTFKGGTQGMADMAMYAEKFKINMEEVFEPMEKGRRLDSVIEMSAQLQVLGGQFANLADPMSMLFESRNDPEAYLKRINEMTKGMVTMNKVGDEFSLEIASPMARDQLAAAAKALGMTTDELTTQALRMREIQQTRSQMFGKGFTSEEKEIIEGLAKFDRTTGRMMVEIGGSSIDVQKLGKEQIKALKQEQVSLKARAEASQTFDEAFKNTVMELKSALLPVLKSVNEAIKAVRPFVEKLTTFFDESNGWVKGGLLVAGALSLAAVNIGAAFLKQKAGGLIGGAGSIMKAGGAAKGGSILSNVGGVAKGAARGGGAARGAGMMKGGLGVGAAAVGIGAGVGVAAAGISKLADSMSKLDKDQAETLENIAMTLAITMPLAAVGVAAIGATATAAALGLLAFGAAVLMVGGGVAIAAVGIGEMAENFASLDGVDLSGIGDGMLKFSGAALALANPIGLVGMAGMTASVMGIASTADDMERVGSAFGQIGAVLQGSASQFKEVRDTIQAIASTEVGGNSAISQLTNMLSKPLKVEFSEQEVGFVANIDLSVGDSGFMTEISKKLPARIVDLQQAKA